MMQRDRKLKLLIDSMDQSWHALMRHFPEYSYVSLASQKYSITTLNDPMFNVVFYFDLVDENAVEALIAEYAGRQLSFTWWVPQQIDSNELQQQLTNCGLQYAGSIDGMVLSLKDQKAITANSTIKIELIESVAALSDWIGPIRQSFGMSAETSTHFLSWFDKLFTEEPLSARHYVVRSGTAVIAAATLSLADKTCAGIYNCATLPKYRHQGILTTMTKHMLDDARTLGYEWVSLQASSMSRKVFASCGFETIMPYRIYTKEYSS